MIERYAVAVTEFQPHMSAMFRRAANGEAVDITYHSRPYVTILDAELADEALEALELVRGLRRAGWTPGEARADDEGKVKAA